MNGENKCEGSTLSPHTAWCGVGDLVSVERWDETETKPKRIGTPAMVTQIETGRYSESGIMVTVIGATGKTLRADMNWLRPHTPHNGRDKSPGDKNA